MNPYNTDMLAFIAHCIPVEMHDHHAVQLVTSLDRPYPAILAGQSKESVQGFLVDAHIPHACYATASTVLVISVDADSTKGKALRQKLDGQPFRLLDDLMAAETYRRFRTGYQNGASTAFDPLELVSLLSEAAPRAPEPDRRVVAAMDFVARHIEQTVSLPAIAGAVGLSEGRLRHLFVRDIGIPIRTYVLWSRMKVAIHGLAVGGMTLTDAAAHAGFADHAHFSRTFRRMFGVSPSILLKQSQFLEVFGAG